MFDYFLPEFFCLSLPLHSVRLDLNQNITQTKISRVGYTLFLHCLVSELTYQMFFSLVVPKSFASPLPSNINKKVLMVCMQAAVLIYFPEFQTSIFYSLICF